MSDELMSEDPAVRPLRIAALVKQIPVIEDLRIGADGRLERRGRELEMSAFCRRAVAVGVREARRSGGTCTVFTLGPPSAEDCLREAIAFGATDGILITDPAFAGSDTLATAQALARALLVVAAERRDPFDLVLVGRNSLDAETGQVGPELAELLDVPFATAIKRLAIRPGRNGLADPAGSIVADAELEHDDTRVEVTVALPAVLSTAERLIDPCKIKDPARWPTVGAARIRTLGAADLGDGPWGQAGSPTQVGETRREHVDRDRLRFEGPVGEQVIEAVRCLVDRGALLVDAPGNESATVVPVPVGATDGRLVAVVVEPDHDRLTRELLTEASRLAAELGGSVVVLGSPEAVRDAGELASWGADELVVLQGAAIEEDAARAVGAWAASRSPWAVLTGSTAWGREVAARVAAASGAGLTGDAVGLACDHGRLLAWKPAFSGQLVAAIRTRSPIQMATVRAGVVRPYRPRPRRALVSSTVAVVPRGRLVLRSRVREDDVGDLLEADVVVAVGQGVDPAHYGELDDLVAVLGAALGATRKVTDKGWMPHARQIGITGHSIAPRLFVAIGSGGSFNHLVGVGRAGTIVAINPDPEAPIFDASDVGIVADWRKVVPVLVGALRTVMTGRGADSGRPQPTPATTAGAHVR